MSVEKIADEFSLDLIVMFGSRARGQSIRGSDTDIAVRSTRNLSRDDELRIAAALDAFFPDVDLCDIRKASPLLLGAIGQDAKLIYERRESLFEEFKIFAWNQYMVLSLSLTAFESGIRPRLMRLTRIRNEPDRSRENGRSA